jgi:glycine cleavage system H lipoate-binding protein
VEDQVSAYLWHLMAGCELHLDRPYSPGHFWLREEGGGETAAGLDGHVMRILYPIDDIVAPRPGVWLRRDEPCGWIMRGRAAIPLETPISGEVLAVNDHYRSAVRRGRATGNGDEWLFRLSTHEAVAEVRTLHRGEETLVWFLKKIQLLKRHIRGAVAGDAAELGVMLADGGVPNPNLGAVLGPDRFAALVDELFHMHI